MRDIDSEIRAALETKSYFRIAELITQISNEEQQSILLSRLISALTKEDLFKVICDIDEALPQDFPLRYVSLFGSAVQSGIEGDIEALETKMKLAMKKVIEVKRQGLPIQLSFVQPSLLHAAYVDTKLAKKCAEGAEKEDAIELPVKIGADIEWVIVVSANGLYFDRFAERYFKSLAALKKKIHFHLQLSAPSAKSENLLRKLLKQFSIEGTLLLDEGNPRPVYLISRRFQIAAQLIDQTNKPVFITDLDIELKSSVNELLDLDPPSYDLALFEFPKRPAMLTSHCSLVLIQPTLRSKFFLKILSRYLKLKLQEEDRLWMLDQIAMFTLSRMAIKSMIPDLMGLRWCDLHTRVSGSLENFQIEQSIDSSEKEELRRKAWPDFRAPNTMEIAETVALT